MQEKRTAKIEPLDHTACNCLALRQASRHLTQIYDRHLAKAGLRATQFSILSKLGRLGAMPIGRLAEAMVMDRTALGRALHPLERERLVSIGAGADGRTRSVDLTAAGEAKLRAASPLWRKAQSEFEDRFGAEDAQALRTTLQRVVSTH